MQSEKETATQEVANIEANHWLETIHNFQESCDTRIVRGTVIKASLHALHARADQFLESEVDDLFLAIEFLGDVES